MHSALVYEPREAVPAIFDFVFRHAAHGRGVPLTLWVSTLNHRAIRLYQRLGFVAVRAVDFGAKGVKIEMTSAIDRRAQHIRGAVS